MNADEAADLLAEASVIDGRRPSLAAAALWAELLAEVNPADARTALRLHRRRSPGVWVEPGHVLELAREVNADLLRRMNGPVDVPAELGGDQAREREWARACWDALRSDPDVGRGRAHEVADRVLGVRRTTGAVPMPERVRAQLETAYRLPSAPPPPRRREADPEGLAAARAEMAALNARLAARDAQ